jgi:hypothetical protein
MCEDVESTEGASVSCVDVRPGAAFDATANRALIRRKPAHTGAHLIIAAPR